MTNEDLARMIERVELRQIIQEKERDLAVAWSIKHPFYPNYRVLEDSSLDNRIESLQTELVHLKDKLKQCRKRKKPRTPYWTSPKLLPHHGERAIFNNQKSC